MTLTEAEQRARAKGIVQRMAKAFKEPDIKGICKHLDCHEEVPSNWITMGKVPPKAIVACHIKTGVSLDYLYSGKTAIFGATPKLKKELEATILDTLKLGERMNLVDSIEANALSVLASSLSKEVATIFTYKNKDQ
jgi:hypothetical protein